MNHHRVSVRALEVDEIAVERACWGDRDLTLTRAEMAAVFRYLNEHGYSAGQIADRLGVTQRTVERWRAGGTFPYSRGDTCVLSCCPECGREMLTRSVPRHLRRVRAAARDAALAERYGDDGRQIGAA